MNSVFQIQKIDGQENESQEDFLAGGGEMGARMRALDWSLTPLGPTGSWPQSLKTSVSICLNSSFALLVWWGKNLVMLYNDAYCPVLGNKHPRALGQTGRECWPEIWDIIGPMLNGVLESGRATRSDDLFLPLDRHGYPEECYFTFSYSPIRDESGGVGGVFTPVQETTEKVIGERRLRTLRDLAAQSIQAKEVEEVCRITAETLAQNPYDLPFACVYLLDNNQSEARLAGTAGVEPGTTISPVLVHWKNLDEDAPLLPLMRAAMSGRAETVYKLSEKFAGLPTGAWASAPETLQILPITLPGNQLPSAILLAAVNPMKAFDSAYESFFNLVAGQAAASIAEARAYHEERKRAEALAEIDRAKTTFFSNVSHEFRTPLTLILGQIEDMLAKPEGTVPAETQEALKVTHRNALRLLKLVNTLLDFSRIEAGRVQALYEPTDLSGYTAELASLFRSTIEKAGMQLLVRCSPLSQPVYVDREMWEKIVLNLLSNAFKFTAYGEIEVRLEERETVVEFSVRDTGVGISEEQLPHIFERFHRVEGTRARTHEGTGIGLALVQELVRLQGGEIRVDSVYGQGTTFTISMPLGEAHLPEERIQAVRTLDSTATGAGPYVTEALRWLPEDKSSGFEKSYLPDTTGSDAIGVHPFNTEVNTEVNTEENIDKSAGSHDVLPRPRILLADDNADMRSYVSGLLAADYDVIAVSDGLTALQAVQESLPDLVLSDVMMPGLDGIGLLQALRADALTKTLPVILLSARAGEEEKAEGLAAQADDYLIKPFSAKELRARVKAHLDMAYARKAAAEAVHQSEEQMRATFAYASHGIALADLDGNFVRVNPAFCNITGHDEEALYKTNLKAITDSADWETNFPLLYSLLKGDVPSVTIEKRYVKPNGAAVWTRNNVSLLRDRQGNPVNIIALTEDITERMHAEFAIQQRAREIEALNARLRRSMTETHHRVKNNLQLISALIDMQRMTGDETVPMSDLARLGTNIRALGVIHDILTREARAGSEQEVLSAKPVLGQRIEVLEPTTGGRSLKSELDDARLSGRQATTLALITNELVSNALKHADGDIEIFFKVNGETATLEVCDNGPGFPAEFDPETSANVGLELVENIARWDLRGQIAYQNRAEGGARIAVAFPITN